MAKKKYTEENQPLVDLISTQESVIEDIIKPAIEEHWAGKVRDFRSKGYSDNQIAGLLRITKEKVQSIK